MNQDVDAIQEAAAAVAVTSECIRDGIQLHNSDVRRNPAPLL